MPSECREATDGLDAVYRTVLQSKRALGAQRRRGSDHNRHRVIHQGMLKHGDGSLTRALSVLKTAFETLTGEQEELHYCPRVARSV